MPVAELTEGGMVACVVAGEEILICRVEGQFYAVSNHCSHAGQRLSTGRLRGFELSCPLHRAKFDVRTGAPVTRPAEKSLVRFPVTLEDGKVNITLSG